MPRARTNKPMPASGSESHSEVEHCDADRRDGTLAGNYNGQRKSKAVVRASPTHDTAFKGGAGS